MIAAEGVNSSGLKMVVRKVLEGVPRPLPNSPAHAIREYHHDGLYQVRTCAHQTDRQTASAVGRSIDSLSHAFATNPT